MDISDDVYAAPETNVEACIPLHEYEEKENSNEAIVLSNQNLDVIVVEGAVGDTQLHREDGIQTPDAENYMPLEVVEKGAELTNEGTEALISLRDEGEFVVNMEAAAVLTNEGEDAFISQPDGGAFVTMEAAAVLMNEVEEALLSQPDEEAFVTNAVVPTLIPPLEDELVCDSHVKGNNMVENVANQAPGEVEDLNTELPVDALTGNEKEGDKDGDANVAVGAEIVTKRVKKSKKKTAKKKKTVKQKAIVAEDEPVVEVRTDEGEENPDLEPSGEVNNSRGVRRRKKKNAKQPSEPGGIVYEAKSAPNEKNKPSGKEEVSYKNKNVDHKEEAESEGTVKKRSQKVAAKAKGNAGELTAEDENKVEPSKSPTSSKTGKTMGMIFMCSSKTKKECFRHKILGLPASKRDMVLSIYKGMELFLFDFESRLLYGIYKAAGPGGYNIEPNVFNSNFPSQVRFTIFNECSPLPEEKFKKVIKDNYYTKNKFNYQLNPDQVKSLCKLFVATSKKETNSAGKTLRVGALPIFERKKKRRAEDDADQNRKKRRANNNSRREMTNRRAKDEERRPFHTRYPPRTMTSGNPQHAVVYEREAYVPQALPTPSYVALPPPAPAAPAYSLSYSYGRTSGTGIYGQERALGLQDRRLTYSELHYMDEGRSDPYPYTSHSSHTEPVVYRDQRYYTSARQDYYSSAVSQDEYRPSSSRTSHYQVPLPPYRRY